MTGRGRQTRTTVWYWTLNRCINRGERRKDNRSVPDLSCIPSRKIWAQHNNLTSPIAAYQSTSGSNKYYTFGDSILIPSYRGHAITDMNVANGAALGDSIQLYFLRRVIQIEVCVNSSPTTASVTAGAYESFKYATVAPHSTLTQVHRNLLQSA